ncbi:MAG: hypothetical protein ABS79_00290 [Planctomycetes bacterium SCN 63-9]|nr:MAG: hypothetical protein ABS79_00290 [Planctomycetes bacterium SCN 63-9]
MAECDRCGLCCRQLIIEIAHVDVVREPRLLPPATRLLDGNGAISYESDWDKEYGLACGSSHPCPMLAEDGLCSIYPTRPNVCVSFEAGSAQCEELREAAGLPRLGGGAGDD